MEAEERQFKIGDLVHEEHFPERVGIVVSVVEREKLQWTKEVVVQWAVDNPNNHGPGPEKIDERYLKLLSRKENEDE